MKQVITLNKDDLVEATYHYLGGLDVNVEKKEIEKTLKVNTGQRDEFESIQVELERY